MRFENYNLLEEHFRILDIDGKIINEEELPSFSEEELL
ncbi:MAG: pyruvate dehydrogenase (acetyl-transferring) E1 component subunit alpha, partial [Tissierellia bacterium]|nr:pyruvate dehydrogenase (acetyl-transferring) E1 component subunit alpha [Tissierellia bacterium]